MADRLNPWGESLPLKLAGDDIPRDGSACDSAATSFETAEPSRDHERRGASFERHRETSEEPSQMTLSTFHGSEPSASNSET
jgi:putative transposase